MITSSAGFFMSGKNGGVLGLGVLLPSERLFFMGCFSGPRPGGLEPPGSDFPLDHTASLAGCFADIDQIAIREGVWRRSNETKRSIERK